MTWNSGFPQTSGSLSSQPIRKNFEFLKIGLDAHASSSANPHLTTLDQVAIANPITGQQITVKGLNDIRFANQFPSIQDAINDLPDGGGTVYIPSGSYPISSTVLLIDNLSFIGEGPGKTVLQLVSGSNCNIINLGVNTQNVLIENITLDGNRYNQGDETLYQLFGISGFAADSNIFIRNVEVKNVKEQGIAINGDNIRIEGCIVDNSKWNGITLGGA